MANYPLDMQVISEKISGPCWWLHRMMLRNKMRMRWVICVISGISGKMHVHCGTWAAIQNYVAKDLFLKDNDMGICLGSVEEIQLHKLRMTMTICYLLTCPPGSHRKGSWPLDLPRACSQKSAGDHELRAVSIFIAISFGCKTLIEL